ncbi:dihydrolipoamide acetyltransferase family protein [Croceicoccus sp. F390]|uniref:Dihydrolipoamide acetyltransferase component of pyruvate dehydrogenase complex n=1 Tax=Croceicoccus esteveae TaxID=3075597 RepID=A0ABU2ZHG1_9SPHN|nr:dihydrolipoamide acetyltransferase family protein [Croceicoccus sp. F390]MDT0575791.1 dihydrolipoamide acetyltransferase family protein [Croceicoccus sp. F390]
MGRFNFRLPDIGEGVAEAEMVVWHVKPGDVIAEDDPLCDVMTDKATVDMTSPVDGKVLAIHGEVGEMRAVGSVIVELEVEGAGNADPGSDSGAGGAADGPEATTGKTPQGTVGDTDDVHDLPAGDAQAGAPAPEPAPQPIADPTGKPGPHATQKPAPPSRPAPRPAGLRTAADTTDQERGDFPLAAPATRRMAARLGLDLGKVPGSGRNGRVTPEDIDDYLAGGNSGGSEDERYALRDEVEEVKIIGLRRRIADRMAEAARNIPHITYVEEFDLTELERLRNALNADRAADQPKLTILPFFVRALVRVLPQFPQVNAHFNDAAGLLHQHGAVHVGIATATPAGLMVPVLRHAETRSIWDSAEEIGRLSKAARDGTASRDELSGSTITITSLGPLGGITTTPIINRPEVAIIGPNKLVDRPVMDGSLVTMRKIMNVSCSFDHRIVDGYEAALFVQSLKRLLEYPAMIFMD